MSREDYSIGRENIAYIRWIGICFCVLVLTLGSCSINKHITAKAMVLSGADPLKVNCLMYSDSRDGVCTILATK